VLTLAEAARAAGEATGTDAVGEAPVTGTMFFMLIGGIAGLGVVIWLVTKFLAK
jgi:hypothetical protein